MPRHRCGGGHASICVCSTENRQLKARRLSARWQARTSMASIGSHARFSVSLSEPRRARRPHRMGAKGFNTLAPRSATSAMFRVARLPYRYPETAVAPTKMLVAAGVSIRSSSFALTEIAYLLSFASMLSNQCLDFVSTFAYGCPDLFNLKEQTFPMSASSGGVAFIDAIRCRGSLTGYAKQRH